MTKKKRVKVNCSYCGKEKEVVPSLYKRLKAHYCNQDCRSKHLSVTMRGKAHRNYSRVKTDCSGCGKPIEVTPSRYRSHKYHFCSGECYKKNIGQYFTDENNPLYKDDKEVTCSGCGKLFKRKPGLVNETGGNYCSHSCYIDNYVRQKTKNEKEYECEQCGKTMKRYERLIENRAHIFCSLKCKGAFYSQLFIGENHPNYDKDITDEEREEKRKYPEYIKWRKSVFARDNFVCQCCGYDKGGTLIAHHIKNYSEHKELRLDIDNGITLCKNCHVTFHNEYGYRNNNKEQLHQFIEEYANQQQSLTGM